MGMMGEFRDFVAKGNVMDMAVGVIIGGAFGKIVDSNFLILAFIIFQMVRAVNNMKKAEEEKPAEPAPTPEDVELLREIRDSLKK